MVIFLDACIAIYLVEEHPNYAARIESRLRAAPATIAYSPLVEMECLILPMRQERDDLIARFRGFFAVSRRLAISDTVFAKATELRARHGLKAPDALHLATALHYGCDELWTNDDQLAKVSEGVVVNVLADALLLPSQPAK